MFHPLPDLDSLRCFDVAADVLNFRAAADRVGLSPGAFSERIRRLEEDLGASLFHRTTRRTRLTDAGRRLVPHARRLLDAATRCSAVVAGDTAPLPYEIRFGTRHELGMSWLCPALGPLAQARPERTIHLYMGDSPDLLARTERGDLDAVVLSARLTSPRLDYATLHVETYAFVGADRTVTRPTDVAQVVLLDVSPDLPLFRYLLDASPDASPWDFARHEYLGGIDAIRFRCLQGAGVAVLPAYFVRDDLAAGRLVQLLPELPIHQDAFRLIWRKQHVLEPRLLELADALRARPIT